MAVGLKRTHDAQLVLRGRTGENADLLDNATEVFVRHGVERAAFQRLGVVGDGELAAMATAVPLWSPVTILIAMPAERDSATAVIASSRGGSMKPAIPRKVRAVSTMPKVSRSTSVPTVPIAKPSTRSPSAVAVSMRSRQ